MTDPIPDFDVVQGLPPWPREWLEVESEWPWADGARHVYPAAQFGAPLTLWTWTDADLTAADIPTGARLKLQLRLLIGRDSWRVPMQWLRIGVHANIGSTEDMLHVLNLTPKGANPAPLPTTSEELLAIATIAAQAWKAAMTTPFAVGDPTWQSKLSTTVAYDKVLASVLEQTQAKDKYGKGGPVSTVLPTVATGYSGGPVVGATVSVQPMLPYEVALAVTTTTRQIGSSYRGRTFLGGLTAIELGNTDGTYRETTAKCAGGVLAQFAQTIKANSAYQLSIVSGRLLSSHEVTGVKVGRIPDVIRARRAHQAENPSVYWTMP